MNDKVILVVSFGTSYNNNRALTIGAIEKDIRDKFPDYDVRRAFTSQMVINILKKRDDLSIDNVKQALERAVNDGVKTVIIQPTHVMDGTEYNFKIKDEVENFKDKFENITIADPLLIADDDFEDLISSITSKNDCDDDTAIVFMGHGSPAESNRVYTKLQEMLQEKDFNNYYIGTVEAKPDFGDVLAMIKQGDYKKILLKPLMVVAGDHAQNDMAGDEEDSWKSMFKVEGYGVECVVEGLAQSQDIRDVYIKHAQKAIDDLN
ncbi:sirohydrochlorin cobaltochelatase [Methanobrevibacter olleyae]|uniref:Cobalt chelatase CbiK n=1 Tax=Methanobrevibacter olleyae TaxID=294671 RepID=A0A126QXB7_METOL|nr:sirohydrochlorin cobaltochelatase [Methanobrevibacter olleyae]AMK14803.1 cobalt chelatase CbiK [Methanobrevibacter olleyae]SFL36002.1 sirohydrochlorin cobaltochelatase [Methanobrevibacter olleyae]